MDVLRTPEERFSALPDYGWEPTYRETADGLRMALVDEGPRGAPVVLLLHGEPSWGFLWRHVLPPLLAAGRRVVVPDLIGFGRSDKPAEVGDHTYARHVGWLRDVLLDQLELREITLVCQDWGGLLGLRLLAEDPDRFARVVTANTGLPDGSVRMPPEWWAFHDFVQRTPDLPIGFLVGAAVVTPLAPEVLAAYDAPFPDAASKAGPRALPGLIPQTEDDVATAPARAAWEVLEQWDRPWLNAFSDSDPITRGADQPFLARVPGTRGQPHTTIQGAGHFLQEDRGAELGAVITAWLEGLA